MLKLKTISWCQEIVAQMLADPMQPNWTEFKRWFFFACQKPGMLKQASFIFGISTEPTLDDYFRFPMSAKMYPLYFLLRPFNLAIDHGPRIAIRFLSGGYDSKLDVR
jgi:hypothetical protein